MFLVVDTPDFVEWVEQELNQRRMTRADLARVGGITRSAVSKFLNRQQKEAGKDMLSAIARAFEMPVEEVYRIAGEFPTRPTEQPPGFLEWMDLFLSANDDQREEMLEYARFQAQRRRKKPAENR